MHLDRRVRTAVRLSLASVVGAGTLIGLSGTAFAAGGFIPGDLIVYEVQGNTSSSAAVSLVDYTESGAPSGFSVNLPTANSGSTHQLTESGSALNDGELTLSADGQSVVATGYDAPSGTTKITSATNTPRTVDVVSTGGTVDSSTVLSDSTTEGQNFRSATTSTAGANIYTGGGAGVGITPDGGTSATYFNADKVHEVQIYNGNLFESTTNGIFQVGSGLPTSGTPADTYLVTAGSNGAPAAFGPDQFAFATLGTGTTQPDTMYVADGSNGATANDPNQVEKYSLESGVWTLTGTVQVPLATGIAVAVYGGAAHLFVTGATSTTEGANTVLYGITDSSGYEGTLSGSATVLANAPSGDAFKGLVFAPPGPGAVTPETPYTLLLPGLAAVGLAGYLVYRRRRGVIG